MNTKAYTISSCFHLLSSAGGRWPWLNAANIKQAIHVANQSVVPGSVQLEMTLQVGRANVQKRTLLRISSSWCAGCDLISLCSHRALSVLPIVWLHCSSPQTDLTMVKASPAHRVPMRSELGALGLQVSYGLWHLVHRTARDDPLHKLEHRENIGSYMISI